MSFRVHAMIRYSLLLTCKKNGKLCHARSYLTYVFWGAVGRNVLASGSRVISASRMAFPVKLATRRAVLEKQVSPKDLPDLPATPQAASSPAQCGSPSWAGVCFSQVRRRLFQPRCPRRDPSLREGKVLKGLGVRG